MDKDYNGMSGKGARTKKIRTSLRLNRGLLEAAVEGYGERCSEWDDVTMTGTMTMALKLAIAHKWKMPDGEKRPASSSNLSALGARMKDYE